MKYRLAFEHGEPLCNDIDELLFEISTRAEPRNSFLLGASSRVRNLLDETYERLVGRTHSHAFRDKADRPWHVKKDQETLDAEERKQIPIDKYYMDDDQLKSIALMIAGSDRIKYNITEMPAIFNEFRDSFKIKGGV